MFTFHDNTSKLKTQQVGRRISKLHSQQIPPEDLQTIAILLSVIFISLSNWDARNDSPQTCLVYKIDPVGNPVYCMHSE